GAMASTGAGLSTALGLRGRLAGAGLSGGNRSAVLTVELGAALALATRFGRAGGDRSGAMFCGVALDGATGVTCAAFTGVAAATVGAAAAVTAAAFTGSAG